MASLDSLTCDADSDRALRADGDVIWSELDRVKDRGVIVPVKLDRRARIPPPFDEMQHLDLTVSLERRLTESMDALQRSEGALGFVPGRQTRGARTSRSRRAR